MVARNARTITPAHIEDAYHAVPGDDHTHLFPRGGGSCLCGRFAIGEKGERAARNKRGHVVRPFCLECRAIQDRRWDVAAGVARGL